MKRNSWADLDEEKISNYIKNADGKVVFGIDGFIDQIWQVVETRKSNNEYILIDKMRRFGEIIVNRGEGGMANELIKKRRSCGGFTANTGRILGYLNLPITLLGMFGEETIDPIFKELQEKCELITLGDPVISNILEFSDGKIMMPYLNELLNFTWNDLVNKIGDKKLKSIFEDADIVSLGYWSNMPTFDEFITKLNENYFYEKYPKKLFFDFANIKKRSVEAIKETFKVLGNLNDKIPVTLSLNEHEAILLFSYYNEELAGDMEEVAKKADSLREKIKLNELVIHTSHYVVAASKTEGIGISVQDYCEKPKITTGAGDTFNGGYVAASIGDLNINERLALANAGIRFYIGNGFPPNRDELIEEVKRIKKALS